MSGQPKETCGTCGESTWSRSLSGVAYCAHCGANFTATCQSPASPESNHRWDEQGTICLNCGLVITETSGWPGSLCPGLASPQSNNHAEDSLELVEPWYSKYKSIEEAFAAGELCPVHDAGEDGSGREYPADACNCPPSPEPAQEVSFNKIDEAFEAAAAQDGFCLTPREAFREGASWMASQQAPEHVWDEKVLPLCPVCKNVWTAPNVSRCPGPSQQAKADPREATDVEAEFNEWWARGNALAARGNAHLTQIDTASSNLMNLARAAAEVLQGYVQIPNAQPDMGEVKQILDNLQAAIRAAATAPQIDTAPLLALAEKWDRRESWGHNEAETVCGDSEQTKAVLHAHATSTGQCASELRAVAAKLSPARDSFTEGLIAARNTQCEWCAKGLRLHEYAKGYFRHYSVDNAPVECGALKIVELLKAGPTLSPLTERQREILRLSDELRLTSQAYNAAVHAKPYSFADCTEASDRHFRAQGALSAAALADERDAALVTTE